MIRKIATAATVAALTLPLGAVAQDMSAEMQARIKAASGSESSNERQVYINGRMLDTESGSYVFDDDNGRVYIRTRSDYDLTPDMGEQDVTAGPLTQAEIKAMCSGDDSNSKLGLPCS